MYKFKKCPISIHFFHIIFPLPSRNFVSFFLFLLTFVCFLSYQFQNSIPLDWKWHNKHNLSIQWFLVSQEFWFLLIQTHKSSEQATQTSVVSVNISLTFYSPELSYSNKFIRMALSLLWLELKRITSAVERESIHEAVIRMELRTKGLINQPFKAPTPLQFASETLNLKTNLYVKTLASTNLSFHLQPIIGSLFLFWWVSFRLMVYQYATSPYLFQMD